MDELERERKSEEILAYYGGMDNRGEQELIVALLRELQDVYGCITAGVIERAAAVTGVKPSFIRALVRMYPTLKEAAFLHDIVVCMGKACADQGGRDILSFLQIVLKLRRNGISRDGKVRVRTQSCLKHCGTAPNLLIDGKLYTGVDEEMLTGILKNKFHLGL